MFCQKAKPDDSRTDRDVGRRGGFTLTELMVALGLALIIILITVTAFRQGAGVFSRGEATSRALNNGRAALRFMQKDLEGAFLQPDGAFFFGSRSRMSFLTTPTYAYHYDQSTGDTEERPGTMVYYFPRKAADQPNYVFDFYRYDESVDYGESPTPQSDWWDWSQWTAADWSNRNLQVHKICFGVLAPPDGNDSDEFPDLSGYGDGNFDRIETRFQYIFNGEAYPGWWSTDPNGYHADGTNRSWQYRRLPDAVVVELYITDRDGLLDPRRTDGANPFTIRRVIPVGTAASAQ